MHDLPARVRSPCQPRIYHPLPENAAQLKGHGLSVWCVPRRRRWLKPPTAQISPFLSSATAPAYCTATWRRADPWPAELELCGQKIYKAARDAGYHYDTKAPQLLPLTLVVGHLGKILFTHSGRSQTDLPEDCAAISEIVRAVEKATAPTDGPRRPPLLGRDPYPARSGGVG